MKKFLPLLLTLFKLVLTLAILTTAAYYGYNKYKEYMDNPWTRDGQVRTQVIQVTPRVSGMIINIPVTDNQYVKKGDLLFEIDPEQYEVQVAKYKAKLQRSYEVLKGDKIEYARVKKIYKRDKGAVSQKDLSKKEVNYNKSLSSVDSAKEALNAAKLNLTYTKVYAEVNGYVSNINFQIGSQAVANHPILALVDDESYWVFGFFREDAIAGIKVGDEARVTLLAYKDTPLKGKVESIAWGIAHADGNPGNNLLPSIKPVFQWIRLAQRIPVKVKLDKLPEDVKLRFGLTASVMILEDSKQKD